MDGSLLVNRLDQREVPNKLDETTGKTRVSIHPPLIIVWYIVRVAVGSVISKSSGAARRLCCGCMSASKDETTATSP